MDVEKEIEAIRREIEKLGGRLTALEHPQIRIKTKTQNTYSGLNGGIQMLLDEGFFETPKALGEIREKLGEKVYHYGKGSISKALSVYFMKRDQKLTRIKEGKAWKYAQRK